MDNSLAVSNPPTALKKALWAPVLAVAVWIMFQVSYNLLGYIDNKSVYRTLASINWILLVLSTGFSTIVIYPVFFFSGASLRMRILASYIVPLVWCLKEFIRVSGNYTAMEALYYSVFESVQLLVLISQVSLIGLCELGCRWLRRSRGGSGPVLTPGSILAVIFSVIPLYFILIYESGHVFSLKLRMFYRYLFL